MIKSVDQIAMDGQSMSDCFVQLSSLNKLTIYGPQPSRGRAALCSFNVEGLHATDISTLLDQEGKLVSVEHMSADLLLAVP